MQIHFERFLNSIWPHKCISCQEESNLKVFCLYCQPSVRLCEDKSALFLFSGAIQESINQIKFHKSETKARRLTDWIVDEIDSDRFTPLFKGGPGGISNFDGITFVPIHWRRRLSRGFDLSALFAITLSKKFKIPIFDMLINTKFDPPLTLSSSREERLKLTRNRYKLIKSSQKTKNILLVDDVITTGATLDSAKQTLDQAGHEITCLALAKTPLGYPNA